MSISACFIKTGASNLACFVILSACVLSPVPTFGQMPMSTATAPNQPRVNQDTSAQIKRLQQQIVQLQAALKLSKGKKGTPQPDSMDSGKPAMGMEDGGGEMEGMSAGAAKPAMQDKMGGMDCMSKMSSPAGSMKGDTAAPVPPPGCCSMSMAMPMAKSGMADDRMGIMPGVAATTMKAKMMATQKMAESPHLLHIGAKDFFLDHQKHIALTPDQKAQLETIKRESGNQKSTYEGQIGTAQEQLWQLTSADQPNSTDIDGKVQEVAQLRAAEQVAFIHSVSAALEVLTPEQRLKVVMPMKLEKSSSSAASKAPTTAPMKMQ